MGASNQQREAAGRARALVVALLAAALPALPATPEVTFLSNEGFLIRSGDGALLIDAFPKRRRSAYPPIAEEAFQQLMAGRGPFAGVKVLLFSHAHSDHFDPELTGRFLTAHPDAVLLSSREVIQAVKDRFAGSDAIAGQLRALPERDHAGPIEIGGFRIEVFTIHHASREFFPDPVLAHLIESGGTKLLHLGDAEPSEQMLAAYRFSRRAIDCVFVPLWILVAENAKTLVHDQLGSDCLVAMSVPASGHDDELEQVERRFPQAIVAHDPLTRIEF